jgi:hypothetical protein
VLKLGSNPAIRSDFIKYLEQAFDDDASDGMQERTKEEREEYLAAVIEQFEESSPEDRAEVIRGHHHPRHPAK